MRRTVTMRTPHGEATEVKIEDVAAAEAAGYVIEIPAARVERLGEEAKQAEYGDTAGQILAGGAGLARGATLGLSDVAAGVLGTEGDVETLREVRRYNPTTSLATEILGATAPALLSGGTGALGTAARATPAGAVSRAALGATERLAGQAPGVARYVGATAAGGAAEGAVQNVGAYVSDVALQNKELSAEGFVGAAGSGALFGGLAGGAVAGIERGTIAARRLFPRSEAAQEAVDVAESQFVSTAKEAVAAGDDLAKTAQQKLDDIALRRAELNLEKLKLRGVDDPAAAERVAQIRVEQAKLQVARREAAAEVAAQRAQRAGIKPEEVAPIAPMADEVIPPAAPLPAAAPTSAISPDLAGVDDLQARLAATQGLLDEGVPFADIGAAARGEQQIDDAIKALDGQAVRIADKLERFRAGKPMADDFIARYGAGAKSKYSATGSGGTRGGGAGPVRTDRTRLLPEEEIEASINDRVFAGIGEGRDAAPLIAPTAPAKKAQPFDLDLGDAGARQIQPEDVVSVTAERVGRPSAGTSELTITLADGSVIKTPPLRSNAIADISDKISPPNFRMSPGANPGTPDYGIVRGVPAPDAVRPNTTYVFKPSELLDVKELRGDVIRPDSIKSVREALAGDTKLPAIDIQVHPDGSYYVADGNHRILAASASDQYVTATFRPVKSKGTHFGEGDIKDRLRSELGGVEPGAASMSGSQLDAAYEDAIERAAGAPSRAAQERALREAADLEDQIMDAVAARGGREADDVAKIRAKRGDLGQDSYTVAVRRAEKRAMAEEGPMLSERAAAERADLETYDRGLRQQQFAGGKTAGQAADELTTGPLADRILGPARVAAPAEVAGLGKFIDDADEAIKSIGELERAIAELSQEMGDATPPKARVIADQYLASVDDQARKVAERTAMTADDAIRAGQIVGLPKPPPVPVSEGRRLGKTVADAASVLDTIQTFTDIPGMPSARDIPVIGPVLSMYLKFRAGRMALKRIGGRIPATAEAKIAAKSSELRDRAAKVVDQILLGASKAAKAARAPAVPAATKLLDTLSGSLYPHEEKRKERPKTAVDAVKARVAELSAAVSDPEGVKAAVRKSVQARDPDVMRAIESATLRKLAYLQKHAPKMPAPSLLANRPWTPSKVEIEKFARRIRAAEDPISVLAELEAGTLTPEAADTLRTVYPALFSDVQMRLINRVAELEVVVPYKRRLTISALFDVPLDDSLQPQNLLRLQEAYKTPGGASPDAAGAAPGGQTPAPSVAAPIRISTMYSADQPRSDRR